MRVCACSTSETSLMANSFEEFHRSSTKGDTGRSAISHLLVLVEYWGIPRKWMSFEGYNMISRGIILGVK